MAIKYSLVDHAVFFLYIKNFNALYGIPVTQEILMIHWHTRFLVLCQKMVLKRIFKNEKYILSLATPFHLCVTRKICCFTKLFWDGKFHLGEKHLACNITVQWSCRLLLCLQEHIFIFFISPEVLKLFSQGPPSWKNQIKYSNNFYTE